MKKIILIILIISIGVLFANPQWLTNPSLKYPKGRYLSAVGEGDTRKAAENEARANLSKIFESQITVSEQMKDQYKELITNKATEYESKSSIDKDISIESEQDLINIEIGETYTNNVGRTFAIAYMDRLKTADIYEEKIEDNANRIIRFRDKINETTKPIKRYAFANAAVVLSSDNRVKLDQLSVISPDTKGMLELNYKHDYLVELKNDAAKAISISLDIEGDNDGKVVGMLKSKLSDNGFTIRDNGFLKLKGKLSFEDVNMKNGRIKYIRWILSLDLINNKSETIVSVNKNSREGGISIQQAKSVSYRQMKKTIGKELISKVNNYINSFLN